jgi:tRNA threonylcarbamoyl adenosine modification protein YeaZ
MPYFLLMQASYYTYQVGLAKDTLLIDSITQDKQLTSSELIPSIDTILRRNNSSLNALSALGVNKGPGPFTSLRVGVTAANGIAFAQQLPLIGINSLEALLEQEADAAYPFTVALLNAYHKDIYYGYRLPDGTLEMGCMNGTEFLKNLYNHYPTTPIRFIGDGVNQMRLEIAALFPETGFIPDKLPLECSLETIAQLTAHTFAQHPEPLFHLTPLYLKQLAYVPSLK